jgi:hypothetical protein
VAVADARVLRGGARLQARTSRSVAASRWRDALGCRAAHGGEACVWRGARLSRPARGEKAFSPHPPAQRHAVWMAQTELVRVDLPVDVIVVLEQQQRAGQAQCSECALGES